MKRYRFIRCLLALPALALLAAACTTSHSSTLVIATPTPALTQLADFDGEWEGTGTTAQGKVINLSFSVSGAVVTSVTYKYQGLNDLPCTNLNYEPIPEPLRPRIARNTFSATLGSDLDMTGTFVSATAASGHLAITWQDRYTTCNGHFEADWMATHKAAVVQAPPPSVLPTLCGPHVNCGEVMLQLLVFGLSNGAMLALNAIGVTLIYSTVRTLNLAHGDVFALTTALVTTLINGLGVQRNWPPALLAGALALTLGGAVLFGALLSVTIERAAFKPFRGRSRLAPLIATLGLSFILFQAALVWRTFQRSWIPGEHRSVPGLPEVPTDRIPNLLPDLDLVRAAGLPLHVVFRVNDLFVLLAAVAFVLATGALLQRTATGRAIRAAAQNPMLAQMFGVNLDQTIRRAFAIGGALAGAAAFVFALYYARPFGEAGAESGLLAFAAALLGGIGNPVGALLSGLLMGVFAAFSDYFMSAQWTPVLLLALLIGLLVLRPTGVAIAEGAEDSATNTVRDAVALTAPGQPTRWNRWLAWIFAALAVFPVVSAVFGLGGQSLVREIGVFILLALGLNLLLGLAGVLDFGYAVSFGIGAYVTAVLTNRWGVVGAQLPQPVDFTVVLLASTLLAALFGVFKGGLATRLRSDYLAVATLALGLLAQRVVINLKGLTGGAGGMGALPPPTLLTVPFSNPTAQYYLVFGLVMLAALAGQQLAHSRTGRAWLAGSEDDTAAAAFGVNVARYKTLALALSSAVAGIAGALYASTFAYVDPDVVAFHVSSLTLAMVILGGAGSVPGAILGAIVIIGYDKVIIPQLAAFLALFWPSNAYIGSVPDIRGASFFNFGIALYLTVLLRARRRE
jgi:branched-subunit amino acid ABC-type transport system permease component